MEAKTKSIQFEKIFIVADCNKKLNQIHHINHSNDGINGTFRFINCKSTKFGISTDIALPSLPQNRSYHKYSLQVIVGRKRKVWTNPKHKWHFIKLNEIVKTISNCSIKLDKFSLSKDEKLSLSNFEHCWIKLCVTTIQNALNQNDIAMEGNFQCRNQNALNENAFNQNELQHSKCITEPKYCQIPDFEPKESQIYDFMHNLSPKFIKKHQLKQKLHRQSEYGQLVLPSLYDSVREYLYKQNKKKYLHQDYKSRCKFVDYSQMQVIKPNKSKNTKWNKYQNTSICEKKSASYKIKHAPKVNCNINILSEVCFTKQLNTKKDTFMSLSAISPFEPSQQDIQEELDAMNKQDVLELKRQCFADDKKDPFLVIDTIEDVIRRNILNQRQQLYHKLRKSRAKASILRSNDKLYEKSNKQVQINLNQNMTKIVSRWIQK